MLPLTARHNMIFKPISHLSAGPKIMCHMPNFILFYILKAFFMCMSAWIYMCHVYARAQRSQVLESLELELKEVGSHQIGSGK